MTSNMLKNKITVHTTTIKQHWPEVNIGFATRMSFTNLPLHIISELKRFVAKIKLMSQFCI